MSTELAGGCILRRRLRARRSVLEATALQLQFQCAVPINAKSCSNYRWLVLTMLRHGHRVPIIDIKYPMKLCVEGFPFVLQLLLVEGSPISANFPQQLRFFSRFRQRSVILVKIW